MMVLGIFVPDLISLLGVDQTIPHVWGEAFGQCDTEVQENDL